MTFYMGTNSLLGFDKAYGAFTLDNNLGHFNATYVDCAIGIGPSAILGKTLDTALAEAWFHFDYYHNNGSPGFQDNPLITIFKTGTAQGLFRLRATDNVLEVQYWNGSAWTVTGDSFALAASTRHTIDFHVKMHNSTGVLKMYLNGVLVGTGYTGDTIFAAPTTMDRFELTSTYNASIDSAFSQIIVADESTIGSCYYQHVTGSDGTTFDFAGSYVDVAVGVAIDSTPNTIATSGAVNDQLLVNFDSLLATSLAVQALVVNTEVRKGATGPQSMNHSVRSAGTTYHGADKAVGDGYVHLTNLWETDPATSVAWTAAGIAAAEAGIRSRT